MTLKMARLLRLSILTSLLFTAACAFSTTARSTQPSSTTALCAESSTTTFSRRNVMTSSMGLLGLMGGFGSSSNAADNDVSKSTDGEGVTLYKLPSGLKYIELEPGRESAPTPRYGQVCVFSYKAYVKLPTDKEKQQFDSSSSFVTKHGNGRIIAGLDEGLHTMRPGGLRRVIIPPKLGFVQSGLGPLPVYPWDRYKLTNLIDKMVIIYGINFIKSIKLNILSYHYFIIDSTKII